MVSVAFDTLKFANRLKEAGFTEQQAEVITELQCEAAAVTLEQAREEYHLEELVTRRDLKETEGRFEVKIKELEVSLKKDIEILRAETKQAIAETRAELIRWVVGVGLLQSTLIIGVLLKVAHMI
jgi:hypothetical protein